MSNKISVCRKMIVNMTFKVMFKTIFTALLVWVCSASLFHSTLAKATSLAPPSKVESLAGCYLVDYSYYETKAIDEGYKKDTRVYKVNESSLVKEWIFSVREGNEIVLQHILFGTNASGYHTEGSMLKHHTEIWEQSPTFWYEFTGPQTWIPQPLATHREPEQKPWRQELWLRKITSLDNGPRHQCASNIRINGPEIDWTCSSYSPIPGRETRDMGRRDYNTLMRTSRVTTFGTSWLERQDNTKMIWSKGEKTPLAQENGRNWYVRLPNNHCQAAQDWSEPRKEFWTLLRSVWREVMDGKKTFKGSRLQGSPPRYVAMWEVEDRFVGKPLKANPELTSQAKEAILEVIHRYSSH